MIIALIIAAVLLVIYDVKKDRKLKDIDEYFED